MCVNCISVLWTVKFREQGDAYFSPMRSVLKFFKNKNGERSHDITSGLTFPINDMVLLESLKTWLSPTWSRDTLSHFLVDFSRWYSGTFPSEASQSKYSSLTACVSHTERHTHLKHVYKSSIYFQNKGFISDFEKYNDHQDNHATLCPVYSMRFSRKTARMTHTHTDLKISQVTQSCGDLPR